jgi:Protein of unknown function (DUF2878)
VLVSGVPDLPCDPKSIPVANQWLPAIYFVVGQIGWFASVLSAAWGVPWIGVVVTLVFIILHLLRVTRPLEEFKLVATVVVIGGAWESVLVSGGLLDYPSGMVFPGLTPYWLLGSWALFAAQFNTTYQWLKSRLWAAALLGAIAGPVSFHAGAALGALHFTKPMPAALALAAGWAVILPAIVLLSRRWDGVHPYRT